MKIEGVAEPRVYTLKAGTRAAFEQRFAEQILPMLQRYGIEVVCAGPSAHDDDKGRASTCVGALRPQRALRLRSIGVAGGVARVTHGIGRILSVGLNVLRGVLGVRLNVLGQVGGIRLNILGDVLGVRLDVVRCIFLRALVAGSKSAETDGNGQSSREFHALSPVDVETAGPKRSNGVTVP